MSKNVLLVGWDPAVVDFSLLPQLDLNEEKLRRALAIDRERLTTIGYRAQWCFLQREEGDESLLIEALKNNRYDCVMIGAGVRLPPDYHLVFEKLVNIVHRKAPQAAICFNTNPADTAAAVMRWV
ncbi:MAG: hypothetical protein RL328_2670 [Acidobacteriota bacterium]|jgi:hypothetical protein